MQGPDDWELLEITVEDGATIGSGAIILGGVTIGQRSDDRRGRGRQPATFRKDAIVRGEPARIRRARLVGAAPAEDRRQGAQDQAHVHPQRPVGHVDVVELDHLVEGDARAAEHLPEAGDARRQVEPAARPAGDLRVLVGPATDAARRGSSRRAGRSRAAAARRCSSCAGSAPTRGDARVVGRAAASSGRCSRLIRSSR